MDMFFKLCDYGVGEEVIDRCMMEMMKVVIYGVEIIFCFDS